MTDAMWLALTSGILGFCGVAIAAIIKMPARKGNGKLPDACPAHSGFKAEMSNVHQDITDIKSWVEKIDTKQDGLIVTTAEIKVLLEMEK